MACFSPEGTPWPANSKGRNRNSSPNYLLAICDAPQRTWGQDVGALCCLLAALPKCVIRRGDNTAQPVNTCPRDQEQEEEQHASI